MPKPVLLLSWMNLVKKPTFNTYTSAVEAIVTVLFIFLIIGDAAILSFQREKLTQQAQQYIQQEFKLMRGFIEQALLKKDYTIIKQFVMSQRQENINIVKLSVYLPNKLPIVEYEREILPKHTFQIKEEIGQANQAHATLDLVYDMTELHNSLSEISWRLIIGSIILTTIIGVCLWITLKRVAILPLEQQIVERQKIEDDLRSAKEISEAANLAKSQFLANMSHEIRTPLNAIVGFSQILLKNSDSPQSQKESKQYLKNIQIAGQTLSELINNILDLAKVESGKMSIQEENLNLEQFLEELYLLHEPIALEKKIIYTYRFDETLPTFIRTDRTKLHQILNNLITNAIKFTPNEKKVTLFASREKDMLCLQVHDEGIGICEQHQSTIFETFRQADGTTTRQYGGTGLGLAITKQLVELLGGEILLKSTPGKGSTFSIYLPFKDATTIAHASTTTIDLKLPHTADNLQKEGKAAPSSNQTNHHFSEDNLILIVEDNPMNQLVIGALFEDYDLKVCMADNGKEGIEKVHELHSQGTPPSLILMDINMPHMDGRTATKELRQIPEFQNIPIIALSADIYENHGTMKDQTGFTDFLAKPVDLEQLMSLLEKYLHLDVSQWINPHPPTSTILEISIPENIPLEDLTLLPQLLSILDSEVRSDWEEINEIITIGAVEDFAKKMQQLGIEYHYKTLENWGDLLLSQTNMFDMEALSVSLQQFPAIIKSIEKHL